MLRKRLTPLASGLALTLCLGLWLSPAQGQYGQGQMDQGQMAQGQNGMQLLNADALKQRKKLAVPFEHDAHNIKADLKDCAVCHHGYRGGKRITTGLSSTDKKCSDCHQERPSGNNPAPSLVNAYHALCQGCHKQQNKGPVGCSQCHKKEAGQP